MPMRHRTSVPVATLAAAATLLGLAVATAPAALAGAVSHSFLTPGGPYDLTVPPGVTQIHVDALGGSGATGWTGNRTAGAGAEVQADIAVTPGDVLHVHVAGNGTLFSGGVNGGGDPATADYYAGGGGGASDVRVGGDTLTDRVVVAAGGGGSTVFGTAGAAGAAGTSDCGVAGAQPGTDSAGGAGGDGCDGTPGQDGALGVGGAGGSRPSGADYGGGGGGGYYGGGGGGPYGGGAGGSNLVPADAGNVVDTTGTYGAAPFVRISYTILPATVAVSTLATSLPADGTSSTQVTATVTDAHGNASPGDPVAFTSSDPGIGFGAVSDNGDGTYTATMTSSTTAGTPTITATDGYSATPVSGTTTIPITALPQTVAFTSDVPATATIGQNYAPTATGGDSGNPVVFSIDATTTNSACSLVDGTVSFAHAGLCVIDADQAGTAQYAAAPRVQQSVPVGKGASSTSVSVAATSVTATVAPQAPATSTPTGTVAFAVDGTTVGSATLSGGVASLTYSVPSGMTHSVSATYAGDADFGSSSASTARQDPSISATVRSATARTRYGWYRTPVTVSFTCTTHGAALTTPCPGAVTLSHGGAAQSVTRSILAEDGGAATVTVSGINLDPTRPHVRVSGVRNGETYLGAAPAARCVGSDALSGVASCRLTRSRDGDRIRFTATAIDRAGNRAVVHGSYRVLDVYFARTHYAKGAFTLREGHTYTLVAQTARKSAPRYYDAVPAGQQPRTAGGSFHYAGVSHGVYRWTLTVHVDRGLGRYRTWVAGVRIGHVMRTVAFHPVS